MTNRSNIPVHEATFERLSELKGDDETWTETMERLADLAEGDNQQPAACEQTARIPSEQVEEIARAASREVENRMARR